VKGGVTISTNGGLHNENKRNSNQVKPFQDGVFKECNLMQHIHSKMISHQVMWLKENIVNKQNEDEST
jgi:hypothetical protein